MFIGLSKQPGLSAAQLTGKIERIPNNPLFLKDKGIFMPMPITTEDYVIDQVDGKLDIVQTSKRGEPIDYREPEDYSGRTFRTRRIAKGDLITPKDLAFVRDAGTEVIVTEVQAIALKRMNGPSGLKASLERTKENMRLGAIQGVVLDKDGSIIRDWYDALNLTKPDEKPLDPTSFSNGKGEFAAWVLKNVTRPMEEEAQGAIYTHAECACGSEAFDELIKIPEVHETYLRQNELKDYSKGFLNQSVFYAGVLWQDFSLFKGSSAEIATDEMKFYPGGKGGSVFKEIRSPGEKFAHLGQEGKEYYADIIPDLKRDQYLELEMYSYVEMLCTRPLMLRSGKLA